MKTAITFLTIIAFAIPPGDSFAHTSSNRDENGCHTEITTDITGTQTSSEHCHSGSDGDGGKEVAKYILYGLGGLVVLAVVLRAADKNQNFIPAEEENFNLQPQFTDNAEFTGVRLEYKFEF